MAEDPKNQDEQKKQDEAHAKKLKELEVALAKELDQQVRLSEPSDKRLDGSVMVNPTLDASVPKTKGQAPPATPVGAVTATKESTATGTAAAPTQGPASMAGNQTPLGKNVDDLSLQDVDDILGQLDPQFQESLKATQEEVGKIDPPPHLESINIGKDFLEGVEKEEPTPEPDELSLDIEASLTDDFDDKTPAPSGQPDGMWPLLKQVLVEAAQLPLKIGSEVVKQLKMVKTLGAREVILGLPGVLKPIILAWVELVKAFIKKLLSLPKRYFVNLGIFLVLLFSLVAVVKNIIREWGTDPHKDPFIRSFTDVANEVQVIPDDDSEEGFDNPNKHPEQTVRLPRMVANLKPPLRGRFSMVSIRLYVEMSNPDAAIEISERHTEVTHIVTRIVENVTFEEADSPEGKERLKNKIRFEVSRILNKGRIKRVFFDSFNIQTK
ncbi:MAG: flagellar basal body-associated FliL family protein [Oligoflexia bacterium]|nr:flagellar basal body-associated FliL family protein [Oligoflexia bacterium]